MNEKISHLFDQIAEINAQDIYLTENQKARVRMNNEISVFKEVIFTRKDIISLWKFCDSIPKENKDWDAGIIFGKRRYRVNLFHQFNQLAAAIRPIRTQIGTFPELGLPTNLITNWLNQLSGLILFTGSTSSGKSTSLASCINWLNNNKKYHIITIEDPIEYLIESKQSLIHQRQVGNDTPSFASGLRSAMRQSPDVILLGEIRDLQSAKIALQASETGHLVLSTLHSNTVVNSFERLTNIFEGREKASALLLLSKLLIGIISQKLLPRKDGGLFLAVEHIEIKAAVSEWLRESDYPAIQDYINRTDNPANCSFLNYLIAAFKADLITEETGTLASGKAEDFQRALRGIT